MGGFRYVPLGGRYFHEHLADPFNPEYCRRRLAGGRCNLPRAPFPPDIGLFQAQEILENEEWEEEEILSRGFFDRKGLLIDSDKGCYNPEVRPRQPDVLEHPEQYRPPIVHSSVNGALCHCKSLDPPYRGECPCDGIEYKTLSRLDRVVRPAPELPAERPRKKIRSVPVPEPVEIAAVPPVEPFAEPFEEPLVEPLAESSREKDQPVQDDVGDVAEPLLELPADWPDEEQLTLDTTEDAEQPPVEPRPKQPYEEIQPILDIVPLSDHQFLRALVDKAPKHRPDDSLVADFEEFAKAEVAISGWSIQNLVRPSGSRSAPLGILLHWPTFTVWRGQGLKPSPETASPDNPCTGLLTQKGFSGTNSFWIDTYCRRAAVLTPKLREKRHTPMDYWPQELREHHEEFSWRLITQSQARVWLIFGKFTKKHVLGKLPACEKRPFLFNESCVEVALTAGKMFVFCTHPEALYHPGKQKKSKGMDDACNFAAMLTGLRQAICQDYFVSVTNGSSSDALDVARDQVARESAGAEIQTWDFIDPKIRCYLIKNGFETAEAAEELARRDKVSLARAVQLHICRKHAVNTFKNGYGQKAGEITQKRRAASAFKDMYRFGMPWRRSEPATLRLRCASCPAAKPFLREDPATTWSRVSGRYLVRKNLCHFCRAAGRPSDAFFIPVDTSIKYVKFSGGHFLDGLV